MNCVSFPTDWLPHLPENSDVVFRIRFKYALREDEGTLPFGDVRLPGKLPGHTLRLNLSSADVASRTSCMIMQKMSGVWSMNSRRMS